MITGEAAAAGVRVNAPAVANIATHAIVENFLMTAEVILNMNVPSSSEVSVRGTPVVPVRHFAAMTRFFPRPTGLVVTFGLQAAVMAGVCHDSGVPGLRPFSSLRQRDSVADLLDSSPGMSSGRFTDRFRMS
ncbi:hypothetical protein ACFUCH_35985 [Streptomyces olivaceus]|uniref:hypothetical protein n=1 Tax=Streptomyces olivaceus TaxID=47716 RepID=UPI003645327C